MIRNNRFGIEAVLSHMNYDQAGRPKTTFAAKYGTTPIVYVIHEDEANQIITVKGYKLIAGGKIEPRLEIEDDRYWVGRSDLVWSDYAVDGDGAPRYVCMHNRFRNQTYPSFSVDTGNPVWVSVLEVSRFGVINEFPKG